MRAFGNSRPPGSLFSLELAFENGRLSKLRLDVSSAVAIVVGACEWILRHFS